MRTVYEVLKADGSIWMRLLYRGMALAVAGNGPMTVRRVNEQCSPGLMQCPACGYYAFNGVECFDCGYRAGGE